MHRRDGSTVGFSHGRIWITHLHGAFDDDAFRRRFLDMIRTDQGMAATGKIRASYSTENAIRRIAEILRLRWTAMDPISGPRTDES
jgi:cobyric acid synthase